MRHERWMVDEHPLGPLTGGESPLTMRHERWMVDEHPLGPSTGNVLADKAEHICVTS